MARYKSPNGMGKKGRDKKKTALESEKYKEIITNLSEKGITAIHIQMIYDRCQEKKQTRIARDTLVTKLSELLDYFKTRNRGIQQNDESYISAEDIVDMIIRNPRIITSDIKNNIIQKCTVITQRNENSVPLANEKIKSNPGIFRKTIQNIRDGK